MSKQTTKSEGKRSRVTITGSGNAVSTGKLCAPLKEIKKRRVEGGGKKRGERGYYAFPGAREPASGQPSGISTVYIYLTNNKWPV